ncbi:uncharacterized protein LOC133929729 isoform X3 [Phragmites australis]|uniref:uncharacterized protein LOC133929729 isoform X3 n=1 Tax=Phragmites australis TaxID=29695 RepID=UPI002D779FD9|nr:uncharacterized protein LOC133929729 isoform X3 [Phragmites australis]
MRSVLQRARRIQGTTVGPTTGAAGAGWSFASAFTSISTHSWCSLAFGQGVAVKERSISVTLLTRGSRLGDHQLRQEEMQIKEKIVPLKVWFASPVNCCTPAGCFGASLSFNHSHECSGESID